MKKLIALVSCLVALSALGGDERVEAVASTSPTAAVSGALRPGVKYAVQCDAAAYVRTGNGASTAAVSTDVKLAAGSLYDIFIPRDHNRISVLAVSGTATCQVFLVRSGPLD